MPKKRRQITNSINTRLSERDDVDLIDWWEKQPNGSGSSFVKAAIRQKIASETDATPATRAELSSAAEWIAEQHATEVAALKQGLEALTRLVATLNKRIESGVRVTGNAENIVATTEPSRPQLSPEEQAERLRKIQDQGW